MYFLKNFFFSEKCIECNTLSAYIVDTMPDFLFWQKLSRQDLAAETRQFNC